MKSTGYFRNLRLYRLPDGNLPRLGAEALAALLEHTPLTPCGAIQTISRGWLPVHDGAFVHASGGHLLIKLGAEEKRLPGAVVKQHLTKRVAKVERDEGRKVGRKEMRELKERIIEELLPKVLPTQRSTNCWLYPKGGWLVVDGSPARAEELIELLTHSVEDLKLRLLQTSTSPSSAMTGWLAANEAPAGFSIDQDLELKAPESKTKIAYSAHALEGKPIRDYIAEGKVATKLALTWNDKISFVLTDKGDVKRITFLDILLEKAEQDAETAAEQFDVDFTLATGEMARLLDDLVEALGGEINAEGEAVPLKKAA